MTTTTPRRPESRSHATKLFLLQMAGESGAGKSTLAGRIGAATGAVVLDMDIVKSAALDAGADWALSGDVSFLSRWALADSLLQQGFSVILDNPCRFDNIVTQGVTIAQKHAACYCFIECILSDKAELGRRIRSRPKLRSQMIDYGVSSLDAPAGRTRADLVREHGPSIFDTTYPETPWLRIDSQQNPDQGLANALTYIDKHCNTRL